MYKEKIISSLEKLGRGELKALWQRIQFDFAPDFGEKGEEIMLRDDIVDKVLFLLHREFTFLDAEVNEYDELQELELDEVDITGFAETLLKEFEIEQIPFAEVMEWQKISDIVNTIEAQLECALHDMEVKSMYEVDTKLEFKRGMKFNSADDEIKQHISGFEVEA